MHLIHTIIYPKQFITFYYYLLNLITYANSSARDVLLDSCWKEIIKIIGLISPLIQMCAFNLTPIVKLLFTQPNF